MFALVKNYGMVIDNSLAKDIYCQELAAALDGYQWQTSISALPCFIGVMPQNTRSTMKKSSATLYHILLDMLKESAESEALENPVDLANYCPPPC